MIKKISVKNYKGFKDEIFLDFSDFREYQFNTFAIKNKLIKSAIIYGKNGTGKSNFGIAIFDLILHLTDKQKNVIQMSNYLNGDSDEEYASFYYEFLIDSINFKYEYRKKDGQTLAYEELKINDQKVFSYNFINNKGDFTGLKIVAAENLKTEQSINMSVLRYIAFNANISEDNPISKLMNFVNNMLWFRSSTDGNQYIGLQTESSLLTTSIIEANKVQDFEDFLRENGVDFNLIVKKDSVGTDVLIARYKHGNFNFFDIASHGTRVLLLYYYWILKLKEASFVFIDEFDAFFHTYLSEKIFLRISKSIDSQLLITTHNTDLMSNNILRPDCYYVLSNGKLTSLPNCTERELREGHNLAKMFKAGEFEDEE